MRSLALSAASLFVLGTSALAQTHEMTIHLRGGETVTIPHDAIARLVFDLGPTGLPDPDDTPSAFRLLRNFPNPFNPSTTIAYEIPATAAVAVRVFDLQGALVAELLRETQPAGRHEVTWHGTDSHNSLVASGVYLSAVECDGVTLSQRLLLVK